MPSARASSLPKTVTNKRLLFQEGLEASSDVALQGFLASWLTLAFLKNPAMESK
jgi:hypothetical protein